MKRANPNHKKAPAASSLKIDMIAKNPITAPDPVTLCTAQAAIFSLFIFLISMFNLLIIPSDYLKYPLFYFFFMNQMINIFYGSNY